MDKLKLINVLGHKYSDFKIIEKNSDYNSIVLVAFLESKRLLLQLEQSDYIILGGDFYLCKNNKLEMLSEYNWYVNNKNKILYTYNDYKEYAYQFADNILTSISKCDLDLEHIYADLVFAEREWFCNQHNL